MTDPTPLRLLSLQKHLTAFLNPIKKQPAAVGQINLLEKYRLLSSIDKKVLRAAVYGKFTEERDRILNELADDMTLIPLHKQELSRKEQRATVFRYLRKVYGIFKMTYEEFKADPAKFNAYGDALFCFDMALATKFGVNFYLYLKTLMNFGTTKHQRFIDNVFEGSDLGCFALSELGHGSNAKDIQTTATYDHANKQYILNTPNDQAMKFWIGNGITANVGVVFAQLLIGGKSFGVHAFVVPLRDQYFDLYPGILIGDCGVKIGLNSLDNGFIIFKEYKIPKDNMLDRVSRISEQGEFISSIAHPEKRFGMQLSSLNEGRIQTNLINCVTIATRFAACRRQFGINEKQESSILEYPSVQYRLLKHLSSCVIFKLASQGLYDLWYDNLALLMDPENSLNAEIHAIISALKPLATWSTMQGIQECRELMGGYGFSQYNKIGFIRDDNDINVTWEGDNNVLIQQTSRFLFESFKHLSKGKKIPYQTLEFLEVNFQTKKCALKNKKELIKTENIIKFFEYKLNLLMSSSMKALNDNLGKFPDIFDAWNHTQVFYLRNAAIAFGELFVLKESFKLIKRINHKQTRKILKKLHDLWALNNLESNLNQVTDYFTNEQIYFIRESIMEICKEIKNEAAAIVDALACPDRVIDAPMGSSDGKIYLRFLHAVYAAPGCFEKPSYLNEFRKQG